MKWRNMNWPAYGPPLAEDNLEGCQEGLADIETYRIEVTRVSEPGPVVETRDLLRRLFGEPDGRGARNPYVARYTRLRASALPESGDGREYGYVVGTADYRYWPSLKLGYIEHVRVSSSVRGRGLGVRLVDCALQCMRGKGIQRIYSFAVNPEGARLLESARFTPEPAEDSERPWRKWFHKQ